MIYLSLNLITLQTVSFSHEKVVSCSEKQNTQVQKNHYEIQVPSTLQSGYSPFVI